MLVRHIVICVPGRGEVSDALVEVSAGVTLLDTVGMMSLPQGRMLRVRRATNRGRRSNLPEVILVETGNIGFLLQMKQQKQFKKQNLPT